MSENAMTDRARDILTVLRFCSDDADAAVLLDKLLTLRESDSDV
jgi:hypothetical protein